jgi:hypothetical protein
MTAQVFEGELHSHIGNWSLAVSLRLASYQSGLRSTGRPFRGGPHQLKADFEPRWRACEKLLRSGSPFTPFTQSDVGP